jgi:hypothetical protein
MGTFGVSAQIQMSRIAIYVSLGTYYLFPSELILSLKVLRRPFPWRDIVK